MLKKFWGSLNPIAKIFFIVSIVIAPIVLISGLGLSDGDRQGIFPDRGIGLGHNDQIQVRNVEFTFITTTDPHYISLLYTPHFLNETRPNFVLFELPYDGKIKKSFEDYKSELGDKSYERWQEYNGNEVTILYKKYDCDENEPCKIPYNGNEQIQFELDEKIDSKSGEDHTIQLRVNSGLGNEAIDFLYDELREKGDRIPIYGFDLVTNNVIKLVVDEKIVLEQSTPNPNLDYYSTSDENRNKFYDWNFDSDIAIEINFKIPSDNPLSEYFVHLVTLELFLISPFVGLLIQYRQKHPHTESVISNDKIKEISQNENEGIRNKQVLEQIFSNCKNLKEKMEYLKGVARNKELLITQFKDYVDGKNELVDETKKLISNPLVVLDDGLKEEVSNVLQICRYKPAWEAIEPALKMARERKMLENGWSRDSPDFNIGSRFVDNNTDEAIKAVSSLLNKLESIVRNE